MLKSKQKKKSSFMVGFISDLQAEAADRELPAFLLNKEDALKGPPLNESAPPSKDSQFEKKPSKTAIMKESEAKPKVISGASTDRNTYQIPTDNLPNTYQIPTDNLPITNQLLTGKLPITNQLLTDKLPVTNQLLTDKLPVTNQLLTDKPTDKLTSIGWLKDIPDGVRLVDFIGRVQAQILAVIFENCVANKSNNSGPISSHVFVAATGSSQGSISVRINAMKKKGLIVQGKIRKGRGGWATYGLPELIYKRLAEEGSSITYQIPTDNLPISLPEAPRLERIDNTSNLSNLSEPEPKFEFDHGDWTELDLAPVVEFGFRLEKIKADVTNQKLKITVHEIQRFLDRFPVHVSELPKKPNKPFGLFMSFIREFALQNKDLLEGAPTVHELQATQLQKERLERNKKILDDAFLVWEATLGEREKRNFVRELEGELAANREVDSIGFRLTLIEYFKERVWKPQT